LILLEFLPVCFSGEGCLFSYLSWRSSLYQLLRIPYWTYLQLLLTGL